MLVQILALLVLFSCQTKPTDTPKVRQDEIQREEDPTVEREIADSSKNGLHDVFEEGKASSP